MEDKTSTKAIVELLPQLDAQQQREVQHFAEFLLQKTVPKTEGKLDGPDWTSFSLSDAMRDTEDEDALYSEDDLRKIWT